MKAGGRVASTHFDDTIFINRMYRDNTLWCSRNNYRVKI